MTFVVLVVAFLVHALAHDRGGVRAGDGLVVATFLLLAGPAHGVGHLLAVLPLDPAAQVSGADDHASAEARSVACGAGQPHSNGGEIPNFDLLLKLWQGQIAVP